MQADHNILSRFLNFPPDFYQRNSGNRSSAWHKVYGVDNLTNNWNLYKKESTCPKSNIYLPSVENMIVHILVMTVNNIHVNSFV